MSGAEIEQYVNATDSLTACRAMLALMLEASLDRTFVIPRAVRIRAASRDASIIVTELPNGSLMIKMEPHQ